MEPFTDWVAANPIASFTILLFASVTIPPLVERLKLPGLVGLLLAGVILGPYGLKLLNPNSETIKLLSDIGKIYLMFVAGLEIDMQSFRRTRNRSLSFGLATFLTPLITGTLLGHAFGFGWNAAILIGSLFASHTLLAYPLVQRLGVVRNEAVTVTVGATIFTDIGALLVLAVCVSIHQGEFSWFSLPIQLGSLAIYAAAVLFGLDWLGKEYFRRTGNEEGNQFLFILLALFLSSVGAQVIHIENIVGAFLAGLAVNDVLGRGAVKEKVEFVGGVLFIPFFFVAMGLLIDIPVFIQTLRNDFLLVAAVVSGLIGSKFLAAFIVKGLHRYSWIEALTMGSLSLPQVAATLAATLVGFQVGLLTEAVFNSVIVLMLVTSVLGPVLTQRFASQLPLPESDGESKSKSGEHTVEGDRPFSHAFKVVVPVHNPATEPHLIEMAALLAQQQQGQVMPLAIAHTSSSLNDADFLKTLQQKRLVLKQAAESSIKHGVETHPILRIDQDVALGISYVAKEQDADLLLMGYGDITTLQARLLGNVIDQVFRTSPCPVAVMRLVASPAALTRILVPVWDVLPHTRQLLAFAQSLAAANHGTTTILCLFPPSTPHSRQEEFRHQLAQHLPSDAEDVELSDASLESSSLARVKIKAIANTDLKTVILRTSQHFDVIVLNAMDIHPAKGLMISDWATPIIQGLDCSMVLFSSNS